MRSFVRSIAGGCIVATVAFVALGGSGAPAAQQTGGDGAQAGQGQRGQQPPNEPAQTPPPIFRTGINFVRVDVIVSDRSGGPVADLKQGDFEVTEDGKPQTIEAFRLIERTAD